MGFLSDDDLATLMPSELVGEPTPIPTQIVSSDEYFPAAQNAMQREVEARLLDMGEQLAQRQGISRRRFFQTASGMAAAFVAMNQTYGNLFAATLAEAATPELAEARATGLKHQFIMDMDTHFLRDDTRLTGFVNMRQAVGKAGWNPELAGKPQTIEDLKFDNYFKEIYLDSDTKVALISSAPSEIAQDWFLTNEMMAATREKVNAKAGSKRMFAHAIFTPGQPGWMEALDHAISLGPDSFKGYTIGDNTHKASSHYPWRMDDAKLLYPAYQKMLDAGIRNVCVHKGLFPPSLDRRFPNLRGYADVSDVGQAARDWPQLNFIIYHSGYRHVGEGADPAEAMAEFDRTGRIAWVSDLADIPELYDVTNVYGDLGQIFANSTVAQPRLAAALLGVLIKGMGADHVTWGTDAVWTGSPQWQIEGLRRLEIPEELQKRYGFAPLGAADGPVKTAIFSGNLARIYKFEQHAALTPADRFAELKQQYEAAGPARSNLRYGYVQRSV
jgi:predicted TIM-barrel fold metal-dependent hydrolase